VKVQELLSSEDKWTQGSYAKDKDNFIVTINSLEAVKWCLKGAIHKCYPDHIEAGEIYYKISKKVRSINQYNDTHTYEEVMELVRELDI
jgi:hypothetical protein